MFGLLREFAGFLLEYKRFWILPILLAVLIVGVISIIAAATPALSPFIYPLF